MKNDLISLLQIASVSDDLGKLHEAVDLVEQFFAGNKLYIRKYESKGKPSIVVSTKDTLTPQIMLSGHLDVVPPLKENHFAPYEENGRIYARGASDMKGVDMAMMYALRELISEGHDLDIALMFTTDEEVGSDNGVKYLLNSVGYKPNFVFLPDSGQNWQICTTEKGLWHLQCTATGKAAHGARPWLGESAIIKLIDGYKWLDEEFIKRWGIPSATNDWIPTVNLGKIVGGTATNAVPDKASMGLDIRFTETVDIPSIMSMVIDGLNKFEISCETVFQADPVHVDPEMEIVKKWFELAGSEGVKVNYIRSHGASDAAHFYRLGIPTLMTMPTCSPAHVLDEWVDLGELLKFKDILKKWLTTINLIKTDIIT